MNFKFFKKFIVFIAICILTSSFASIGYASEFKSDLLNKLTAKEPVSVGALIKSVQILANYVHVDKNGDTIFYAVTSGPPAIFFGYNIDQQKIITEKKLISTKGGKELSAKVSYAVDMGADGIINIPTQGYGLFFRYNPETDELKDYGELFEETAVMHKGVFDSEGNYYFGTYPNAKLIKYDVKQDKLVDLGANMVPGNYIRTLVGYKDKLFMLGIGSPTATWAKYDIKTKKVTEIKNPTLDGKFGETDLSSSYSASVAGKYMFAICKMSNINMNYRCVFDMEKEVWTDFIPYTLNMDFTGFDEEIVYFHNVLEDKSGAGLFTYNPEKKEIKQIAGIKLPTGYMINPKVVKLKDQAKYPGKTIVAGANELGLQLINLETKTVEYLKEQLPSNATTLRDVKAGINNDLILSSYMGSKAVIYDTEKQAIRLEFPSLQIEGINVIDNLYYCGMYGTARLQVFDPTKPIETNKNPKYVANMTEEHQDRAFVVSDAGENVLWGTVPNYGALGGAVGVYHKSTGKYVVYNKPIENQSIGGLAYKNEKIYGATHIFGGLGIDPIDDVAKMFIMDLKTGKVEKKVDIVLKTDKEKQYFAGEVAFAPNGDLLVSTQKTLLFVDPKTLTIKEEMTIGSQKINLKQVRYIPYRLRFGSDGLLYSNIGYRISAIDLATKEVKQLLSYGTNGFDIASDSNIYFMQGDQTLLGKLELNHGDKSSDSVLNESVSLMLGKTNAIVKGETKPIDANSPVFAKTIDGRTVVPVRFIAESFGAEVLWNEDTQTVTVKLNDKEIKTVLNEKKITVNGTEIPIDVAAFTENGRTLLPLRAFIQDGLGKTIFWKETGVNQGLIVISSEELLKEEDTTILGEIISKFNN